VRIGSFDHNPSAVIVVAFLVFLAALLSLGTWQMHRAAEKEGILAVSSTALDTAPVALSQLTNVEAAAAAHTRVIVEGSYRGDTQFLWDNRVHNSQAGFEVITPLATDTGIVLVNRGWVAPGRTRQDLPNVALPEAVADQTVSVVGLFSRPSKGLIRRYGRRIIRKTSLLLQVLSSRKLPVKETNQFAKIFSFRIGNQLLRWGQPDTMATRFNGTQWHWR